MIRAIYDVKGIDIGNKLVRYKAEIDLDGAELTMLYLDKTDLGQMLKEVKSLETIDELETFMVKHGENIVDSVGREIDRIECKIKVIKINDKRNRTFQPFLLKFFFLQTRFPEVRHMDLEIL
jgi:zinc transporter 9